MRQVKSCLALFCVLLLLLPGGGFAAEHSLLSRISRPYRQPVVSSNSTANSSRIESLLRAGNLYLSLQDAIALALENNIDLAIQRYGPQIADATVMQAEAGGFARGGSTTVTAGPTSATVNPSGTTPGTNQNAVSQASAATASAVGGGVIQSSGPAIPNLDPTLTGTLNWAHNTAPQSSAFITGTNFLVQRQDLSNLGVSKGFLTGTTVSLGLNNNHVTSNN